MVEGLTPGPEGPSEERKREGTPVEQYPSGDTSGRQIAERLTGHSEACHFQWDFCGSPKGGDAHVADRRRVGDDEVRGRTVLRPGLVVSR